MTRLINVQTCGGDTNIKGRFASRPITANYCIGLGIKFALGRNHGKGLRPKYFMHVHKIHF